MKIYKVKKNYINYSGKNTYIEVFEKSKDTSKLFNIKRNIFTVRIISGHFGNVKKNDITYFFEDFINDYFELVDIKKLSTKKKLELFGNL